VLARALVIHAFFTVQAADALLEGLKILNLFIKKAVSIIVMVETGASSAGIRGYAAPWSNDHAPVKNLKQWSFVLVPKQVIANDSTACVFRQTVFPSTMAF